MFIRLSPQVEVFLLFVIMEKREDHDENKLYFQIFMEMTALAVLGDSRVAKVDEYWLGDSLMPGTERGF